MSLFLTASIFVAAFYSLGVYRRVKKLESKLDEVLLRIYSDIKNKKE